MIGLFTVTFVTHVGLLVYKLTKVKKAFFADAAASGLSMDEFLKTYEKMQLSTVLDSNMTPIMVLLFTGLILVLYTFFIWYKEWFGSAKRIYTLLTIKGTRFKIFGSKLIAFLFAMITFYGVTFLALLADSAAMKAILPAGTVGTDLVKGAYASSFTLGLAVPGNMNDLIYQLLFATMIFAIASVVVLLDRSKRIWGLVAGLLYGMMTMALFFGMNFITLYTMERLIAGWAFIFIIGGISTLLANYLLKNKVSI